MLGCTPKGRFTEQHDIFFGIETGLKDLVPDMNAFWPEANGRIHIDAWQKITTVDGFSIEVVSKETPFTQEEQLFFLNLGGYKEGEFEEYHYKVIEVAKTLYIWSELFGLEELKRVPVKLTTDFI